MLQKDWNQYSPCVHWFQNLSFPANESKPIILYNQYNRHPLYPWMKLTAVTAVINGFVMNCDVICRDN